LSFREWLVSEKTKFSATGLNAGGRSSGDKGMYKPAKPFSILSKKTPLRSF
jgi:hypothetical protein